jgi:hypothetical protein
LFSLTNLTTGMGWTVIFKVFSSEPGRLWPDTLIYQATYRAQR